MSRNLSAFSSLVSVLFLTACGGGGGSSEGGTNPVEQGPSNQEIIQDPKSHPEATLKSAHNQVNLSNYKGSKESVELELDSIQTIYSGLFIDSSIYFLPNSIGDLTGLSEGVIIDETIECNFGGLMKIKGTYQESSVSTFIVDFESCNQDPYFELAITGSAAVKINSLENNNTDFTFFIEDLVMTVDGDNVEVQGYQTLKSSYSEVLGESGDLEQHDYFSADINMLVTKLSDNSQILEKSSYSSEYTIGVDFELYTTEHIGELYLTDLGRTEFKKREVYNYSYDGVDEFENVVDFSGTNNVRVEVTDTQHVKLTIDADKDGTYETGAYVGSVYYWVNEDLTDISLVATDLISLPPTVYSARFENNTVTTMDDIIAIEGFYEDPDTDYAELTVTYRWYVNDVLQEDITGNVFPARRAVYGDSVSVAMLVSDGINNIEGYKTTINIKDTPVKLTVSGAPETVNVGDNVQFTALLEDPDLLEQEITAPVMVSAPQSATIDEDGTVNWEVTNDSVILPVQSFTFTFAIDLDTPTSERISVDLKVVAERSLPLVRSGIEVPKSNYSMWIGDFDADRENEVLSTDSDETVFLLSENNGQYSQKWMYPFAPPTKGPIVQVLMVNMDEDLENEILIITQFGVSVIKDMNSTAETLFESEEEILFAAIADTNNDGLLEFAYLSTDSEYSSGNQSLTVLALEDGTTEELFSIDTQDAKEFVFGNVDADPQLELVVNTGLVYDGESWANEWFNGTTFGDSLVAVVDFDGDGISEIVGAHTWGDLKAFSAVDKSQLASMDNFNTCSLNAGSVDSSAAPVLIVGDCQWGAISAYTISAGTFTKLWDVDMQEHGSKSVALGDSDNDGLPEVHWGSGQDVFIAADVSANQATYKEGSRSLQLDTYSAAGWHEDNTESTAVFFIPSTESGYGGSVIAQMTPDGSFTISDEISSNWDNSHHAAVSDFNNDGITEAFVPNTNAYSGGLSVIQLNDLSVQWEVSGSHSDTIGVVKTFDLNNDSFDDAMYGNDRSLQVVDIQNEVILGQYTFDAQITDFSVIELANVTLVSVSTPQKVHLLEFLGSSFAIRSSVQQVCNRIEFANVNTDDAPELVCLSHSSYNNSSTELIVYELDALELLEQQRNATTFNITDFAVNTSVETNQTVFAIELVSDETSYSCYDCNYQLAEYNINGAKIWSSDVVLGQPVDHGLKYRNHAEKGHQLLISTQNAMHWINP